ncbi:VOC family protein [Paenibacillus sp. GCM10028914]|uniref:VOC family protein n=1 Tax=Paenibacillus sp. GCM10028914 TaxID=3273416 RepID=UPI0036211485
MDRSNPNAPGSTSPIQNKIGSVFVPVKNIEHARDWYCQLLGIDSNECEILNGHLCPLPMQGTGIILDTMPMWGGKEPSGAPPIATPAFMLLTKDLEASLSYARAKGVSIMTVNEQDPWFVIKDPDGNALMVCRE